MIDTTLLAPLPALASAPAASAPADDPGLGFDQVLRDLPASPRSPAPATASPFSGASLPRTGAARATIPFLTSVLFAGRPSSPSASETPAPVDLSAGVLAQESLSLPLLGWTSELTGDASAAEPSLPSLADLAGEGDETETTLPAAATIALPLPLAAAVPPATVAQEGVAMSARPESSATPLAGAPTFAPAPNAAPLTRGAPSATGIEQLRRADTSHRPPAPPQPDEPPAAAPPSGAAVPPAGAAPDAAGPVQNGDGPPLLAFPVELTVEQRPAQAETSASPIAPPAWLAGAVAKSDAGIPLAPTRVTAASSTNETNDTQGGGAQPSSDAAIVPEPNGDRASAGVTGRTDSQRPFPLPFARTDRLTEAAAIVEAVSTGATPVAEAVEAASASAVAEHSVSGDPATLGTQSAQPTAAPAPPPTASTQANDAAARSEPAQGLPANAVPAPARPALVKPPATGAASVSAVAADQATSLPDDGATAAAPLPTRLRIALDLADRPSLPPPLATERPLEPSDEAPSPGEEVSRWSTVPLTPLRLTSVAPAPAEAMTATRAAVAVVPPVLSEQAGAAASGTVEQVAAGLTLGLREGRSEATITLRPAVLGPVKAQIVAGQDGLIIRLSAERDAVGDLLRARLPELREALAGQQVAVAEAHVLFNPPAAASVAPAAFARPDAAPWQQPRGRQEQPATDEQPPRRQPDEQAED